MLDYFQRLFEYTAWADGIVLDHLRQWEDRPQAGSRLMSHIIAAQLIWLRRLDPSIEGPDAPWPEWNVEACAEKSAYSLGAWRNYLETVPADGLVARKEYKNLAGHTYSTPLHEILTHVLNHSTYHRGQIISAARAEGLAPPSTDFILFTRESP